jgi:diacylglycerol kinase
VILGVEIKIIEIIQTGIEEVVLATNKTTQERIKQARASED